MAQISTAALKILGKVTVSGGLVASGSGIASLTRRKVPEEEREVVNIEKLKNIAEEEVLNRAEKEKVGKYILYKKQSFVIEQLYRLKDGFKPLLYDYFLGKENHTIYYILKSDKTRIRIRKTKPQKPNQGMYKGWDLYEFSRSEEWWDIEGEKNFPKTWYGYCYPDPESEKQNCENLPDGWAKKKIVEETVATPK